MGQQKHPPGLYVLFFTEMWERFGFYSMLSMFVLYLTNSQQGFGWTDQQATDLYSNYLMYVYASPLIGGWIADRKLGYRNAVLLGGLIFMVGYFLFSIHSLTAVYAALTCLIIGNGFFKPNVSTMVGHLYPEGSPLKDRAYNIFYMGINIGALLAPINAGLMVEHFGYPPAFAVAGLGMVVSMLTLWSFRRYVEAPKQAVQPISSMPHEASPPAAAAEALPAPSRPSDMEQVPAWQRIGALLVIFLIVIVFWMVFNQNGSTLTLWAKDNTNWASFGFHFADNEDVAGIISNAINPFWVIVLTFPLVWFWGRLANRGLEPSTPTKMALGMLLLGVSFFVLYGAARTGEATVISPDHPYQYKVSLLWLIGCYAIATLGELMLSPMGLSLVSKVAPTRLRGLMMGGWFVATAIGGKLTMIGVYWHSWPHSTFFAVLGGMALFMAGVLFLLLKPLKKAMPGV
jgi:POT family proton-dependent oligopeptide transporter